MLVTSRNTTYLNDDRRMKASDNSRMGVATTVVEKTPRERSAVKKVVNKWDKVMSKISEPSKMKPPAVSQVKSKVFQNLTTQHKPTPTSSIHVDNGLVNNGGSSQSSRSRLAVNNLRNTTATPVGVSHPVTRTTLIMDHHLDHDRYSVQSSTESESSLQESSGPPSSNTIREKKKTIPASKKHRHPSDLSSSASDHSVASQRRMPLPTNSKPVFNNNKGTSKLTALTSTSSTTLTSTSSLSTNPSGKINNKKKIQPTFTSVQSLNSGCKSVPSKIVYSARNCAKDRTQRMGPDGGSKLVGSTGTVIATDTTDSRPPSEGRVPSHIVQSTNHHHHHNHHNHTSNSQNVAVSQATKQANNLPIVINTNPASSNLIPAPVPDPVNPTTNNNNNNNNNNNGGALAYSRLKEELALQYELNANLKTKLEEANSTFSKEKCDMEAELKVLSQKFIAMTIIAHNFDVQRSILEKKLADERATGQGRENQLANERLEEIQNLRVEFERERECINEELQVMRKKDEAQVEQLKELGAELSKKEEHLRTITQEFEDENAELKRKHQEELEAIRVKYREEAQEEVKYQVLKRTLSSPQPTNNNSPNDVLQKEIHSLQVVIDMRNAEIRQLGQEILTQKSFSEDLVNCKEQNKGLLAKVEDLKAQLAKSRHDKHEVQEKYQVVESQADQAVHQLAQLQLENEQLKWRLQSIRTDERVSEMMSKSAVQLGCDKHMMNLDYESAMSSLLDPGLRIEVDLPTPNGCVK